MWTRIRNKWYHSLNNWIQNPTVSRIHVLTLNFLLVFGTPLDDATVDEARTTGMPTTEQDNNCPDMFLLTSSGCFYVQTDSLQKKTWQEAEHFCQGFGNSIHLAEPNTPEVFFALWNKVVQRSNLFGNCCAMSKLIPFIIVLLFDFQNNVTCVCFLASPPCDFMSNRVCHMMNI